MASGDSSHLTPFVVDQNLDEQIEHQVLNNKDDEGQEGRHNILHHKIQSSTSHIQFVC